MTLRWINEKFMLQRFPNTIAGILESVGWEEFAQYRSKNASKYAEVRLFKAIGSDKVLRQFGIINAYDLDKPTFPDNRLIPLTSNLANIGVGDGVKKTFNILSEYILPGSERIQINDADIADTEYKIDRLGRTITFNTPPTGIIKATYSLSTKAFEPTNTFGIFLFDDVSFDITTLKKGIGTANGTLKVFNLGVTNVKPGSVKVYVNNVLADDLSYTVKNSTGEVTFYDAPTTGEVSASYTEIRQPIEGNDYGDLIATGSGDLSTSDGLGNLAFSAASFIKPSVPTVMTFTNEDNFNPAFGRDSLLHAWGSVSKDRLILFLRMDAASNPDNIWHVPLYLGRLNNAGKKPRQNTVLIGGCRAGKAGVWTKDKKLGNHLVDYGMDTANGNNFAMLQQSIGGSYYQKHYLAFITHDKAIERPESGRGPSVYDDMYHDSLMGIVHPYDKEVGVLDDVYAVHPSGLEHDAELEVEKTVVHERIGIGDGITKVFHLFQRTADTKPSIYFDCKEQTNFTYSNDYKAVEFSTAPPVGTEITSSYIAANMYQYNLAESPITPMRLESTSPYAPIGWGIFKEKI
ncbi:hypothetical protein ABE042_20275 [Viridibacillus arvi]|uniref:hypothetical protein n=1 Tax=Viridibacillus arvi TaxID=263475 RepID=UPI003D271080